MTVDWEAVNGRLSFQDQSCLAGLVLFLDNADERVVIKALEVGTVHRSTRVITSIVAILAIAFYLLNTRLVMCPVDRR